MEQEITLACSLERAPSWIPNARSAHLHREPNAALRCAKVLGLSAQEHISLENNYLEDIKRTKVIKNSGRSISVRAMGNAKNSGDLGR